MPKPRTYTMTDGQTVTTASTKRLLVVLDRGNGAHVHTRTNDAEKAHGDLVRNTGMPGTHGWVVDTATGEVRHEMWGPGYDADLDAHLAECRARMDALTTALLAPKVRLGDQFDTPDGPLFVTQRMFPNGTAVDAVVNHTAIAESATLTEDGRYADPSVWHDPDVHGDNDWVRYERYTAEGRVAHGFVDSVSRHLVQSG